MVEGAETSIRFLTSDSISKEAGLVFSKKAIAISSLARLLKFMELTKYVNSEANLVRKKIESCRGNGDLMTPPHIEYVKYHTSGSCLILEDQPHNQ
jgi:hypothetical protein